MAGQVDARGVPDRAHRLARAAQPADSARPALAAASAPGAGTAGGRTSAATVAPSSGPAYQTELFVQWSSAHELGPERARTGSSRAGERARRRERRSRSSRPIASAGDGVERAARVRTAAPNTTSTTRKKLIDGIALPRRELRVDALPGARDAGDGFRRRRCWRGQDRARRACERAERALGGRTGRPGQPASAGLILRVIEERRR